MLGGVGFYHRRVGVNSRFISFYGGLILEWRLLAALSSHKLLNLHFRLLDDRLLLQTFRDRISIACNRRRLHFGLN